LNNFYFVFDIYLGNKMLSFYIRWKNDVHLTCTIYKDVLRQFWPHVHCACSNSAEFSSVTSSSTTEIILDTSKIALQSDYGDRGLAGIFRLGLRHITRSSIHSNFYSVSQKTVSLYIRS